MFCCSHEFRPGDFFDFAIEIVLCGVAEGEQDAAAGPGKFVS